MKIDELKNFANTIKGKLNFNYDLKKTNWFNIGGKAKAYFKPDSLNELVVFLKKFGNKGKILTLGAGSNVLINDKTFDGVIIKLGKNFSNISVLPNGTIIAGSSTTDKKLSEFALENSVGGLEFLACIPGTVGGGLRMNSGCFKKEFKDVLLSVQAIDKNGRVLTIPSSKIKFGYRENDLDKDLIFLSASFRGEFKEKQKIEKFMKTLKEKKNETQPTKIKTGGSTFKNPISQTNQKVWELIKKSVPIDTKFGDAEISDKHCNFFVNRNNASFDDMKKLINFVKEKVKLKTGIKLETEVEIIN
ncbi:MAG: UDP-N-acetylmuramate dehydrogenase [Pelagibacterales bacterium]|nr:UDP-N-acetylmuramate dehydrogenase [Pelagibacterales bacterium]